LKNSAKGQQGSILILSLWILAILSLMAASLSFYAMIRMKVLRFYLNQVQGRYLAEAGINTALKVLIKEDKDDYQALTQKWSSNDTSFEKKSFQTGSFVVSYTREDEQGNVTVRYGLLDEERKININTAPKDVLLALPDATEELVDSIVDWLDKDSGTGRQGAEKDYYADQDPAYPSKDGPMEALEEMMMIKGMTPEIMKKWKPYLTVYGDGRININTASADVLKVAGLNEDLIEKIMAFRSGIDEKLGTEDDGVFKDEGGIARTLFEAEPLNSNDTGLLINLVSKGVLGVKSKHFWIQSNGRIAGSGKNAKTISAIVEHIQADEFKIKYWQEE
jgi:general secretion pathway protein K